MIKIFLFLFFVLSSPVYAALDIPDFSSGITDLEFQGGVIIGIIVVYAVITQLGGVVKRYS